MHPFKRSFAAMHTQYGKASLVITEDEQVSQHISQKTILINFLLIFLVAGGEKIVIIDRMH